MLDFIFYYNAALLPCSISLDHDINISTVALMTVCPSVGLQLGLALLIHVSSSWSLLFLQKVCGLFLFSFF